MSFKDLFKGTYKAYTKCPNCGFGSEVKIPKGISVADFVKGGKCKCDNCQVVFYPTEYTTEHFEKDKRKELVVKQEPNKELMKSKNLKKLDDYKEGIKWLS